jgi:hypothetical protein
MKMSRKIKTLISLFAFAGILLSSTSFALAQVSNGMKLGHTCTGMDQPGVTGHRVYRIDLNDPGNAQEVGLTNVSRSIDGQSSDWGGHSCRRASSRG